MLNKERLNFETQLEYCIDNAPSQSLKDKMLNFKQSYITHNNALMGGMVTQVFKAYEAIKIYSQSKNLVQVNN
jgi:hypothetical protein